MLRDWTQAGSSGQRPPLSALVWIWPTLHPSRDGLIKHTRTTTTTTTNIAIEEAPQRFFCFSSLYCHFSLSFPFRVPSFSAEKSFLGPGKVPYTQTRKKTFARQWQQQQQQQQPTRSPFFLSKKKERTPHWSQPLSSATRKKKSPECAFPSPISSSFLKLHIRSLAIASCII